MIISLALIYAFVSTGNPLPLIFLLISWIPDCLLILFISARYDRWRFRKNFKEDIVSILEGDKNEEKRL